MRFARVLHPLLSPRGEPRFTRVDADALVVYDGDPVLGGQPTGTRIPLDPARPDPLDSTGSAGSLSLLAPVAPSKIVAIGQNYRAHCAEMGKPVPSEPLLFLKPPSALLAPGAAIERPSEWERTDFEGELGVVIGRRARHVSRREALDFVFGLTIVNDVTVRDLQKKDVQFTRAKGFDTFCPVGPVVATDLDPGGLEIRTRVNGQLRQAGRTDDMVFGVAELIAFISRVMTLEPGDLISTGTPPGVGPISPGDLVEVEIPGIGTLRNPVVAEAPAPRG